MPTGENHRAERCSFVSEWERERKRSYHAATYIYLFDYNTVTFLLLCLSLSLSLSRPFSFSLSSSSSSSSLPFLSLSLLFLYRFVLIWWDECWFDWWQQIIRLTIDACVRSTRKEFFSHCFMTLQTKDKSLPSSTTKTPSLLPSRVSFCLSVGTHVCLHMIIYL